MHGSMLNFYFYSKDELHRLLLHIGKGLKYIHSRQLVHLDIKPGNILLALEHDLDAVLFNTSTDSGAASGDASASLSSQTPCTIRYKIGDLGHMAPIQGDLSPTEGDCRYMAPEFLQMESVNAIFLAKDDVFSTGMTLYEAASLQPLLRNSEDSPSYEKLLPYLPNYSKKYSSLLRSLVYKDPARRIPSAKLVSNHLINPLASKSKTQLWRELHQTKVRLAELEKKVGSG